jgi:hypothetical protein
MLVLFGYTLIAIVAAAAVFYLVIAFLPSGLTVTPERDQRPSGLPEDRRMVPDDLQRVRLPVALRGYRFAETDELIDRLAAEIAVRDEELAKLRGSTSAGRRSVSVPGDGDAGDGHD